MPQTRVGVEEHNTRVRAGDAWVSHPDGTVVSAASGHSVDYLYDRWLGNTWQSAGLAAAQTRLIKQWVKSRSLGGVALVGHNLSELATYRILADSEWVARRTVEMDLSATDQQIATGATVPTSADFTFRIVFRIPPHKDPDTGSGDALVFHDAYGAPSLMFRINLRAAPNDGVQSLVYRGTGAGSVAVSGVEIDDGLWHEIILRVKDSTTTQELIVDGAEVSDATVPAFVSTTNEILTIGRAAASLGARLHVSEVSYWTRYITDGELDMMRSAEGHEADCELLTRMTGTGTDAIDLAGNHTLTIAGAATARGMRWNDAADVDTGVKQAFGPWLTRRALRLKTGDSVKKTVSEELPRYLTFECFFRLDQDKMLDTLSGTEALAWWGTSEAATDGELRVAAGAKASALQFVSRGATQDLSTYADGLSHHLKVTVDGQADLMDVWVDEAVVVADKATAGGYTTQASYEVGVQNAAAVGVSEWDVSEVRLYEAERTAFNQYERLSPHADITLRFYLPLDEDTTEMVSEAAATVGGTLDWIDFVRADAGVAAEVFRGRSELGIKDPDDPVGDVPKLISEWWTPVTAKEMAVVIFDPINGDSYVELGFVGAFSMVEPDDSRIEGGQLERVSPGIVWSPAGLPRDELGSKRWVREVTFAWLSSLEAHEFAAALSRVGSQVPIFVVASDWLDEVQTPWATMYGVVLDGFQATEGAGERYTMTLRIAEVSTADWRGP